MCEFFLDLPIQKMPFCVKLLPGSYHTINSNYINLC